MRGQDGRRGSPAGRPRAPRKSPCPAHTSRCSRTAARRSAGGAFWACSGHASASGGQREVHRLDPRMTAPFTGRNRCLPSLPRPPAWAPPRARAAGRRRAAGRSCSSSFSGSWWNRMSRRAFGLRREVHRLPRRRVPPAGAELNELVRVHRVVNQGVGAGQELHQPRAPISGYRIRATGAQLVVGEVGDLPAAVGRGQPIAERGSRMPEPEGAHVETRGAARRPRRCRGPRCSAASALSGTGKTIGSIWRRRISSSGTPSCAAP